MSSWYCRIGGKETGAMSSQAVRMLAASDKLQPSDWVRKGMDGEWVPVSSVKGLLADAAGHAVSPPHCQVGHAETSKPSSASHVISDETQEALAASRTAAGVSRRNLIGGGAIALSLVMVLVAVAILFVGRKNPRVAAVPLAAHEPAPNAVAPGEIPAERSAKTQDEQPGIADQSPSATGALLDGSTAGPVSAETDPTTEEEGADPPPATGAKEPVAAAVAAEEPTAGAIGANPQPTTPFPGGPVGSLANPQVSPLLESNQPGTSAPMSTGAAALTQVLPPVTIPETAATSTANTVVSGTEAGGSKTAEATDDTVGANVQPLGTPGQQAASYQLKRELQSAYEQRKKLRANCEATELDFSVTKKQLNDKTMLYRGLDLELTNARTMGDTKILQLNQLLLTPGMSRINGALIQQLRGEIAVLQVRVNELKMQGMKLEQDVMVLTKECGQKEKKSQLAQLDFVKYREKWLPFCDLDDTLPDADQKTVVQLCSEWLTEPESGDFPEANVLRGFARLNVGEHQDAGADFQALLKRSVTIQGPGVDQTVAWIALLGRGLVYAAEGREKEAKADLDKGVKLNPKAAFAYVFRGRGSAAFGRDRAALDDFIKATQLAETSSSGYREAGWLLATSKGARDGRRALEFSRKACELTAWGEWRSLVTHAAAQAVAGDFSEAAKWATKAVGLCPAEAKTELEKRIKLYQAGVAPLDLKRL